MNLGRVCRCLFASIVYPGICLKCSLVHENAERLKIRATEIPFRFYTSGELTWHEFEDLQEKISRHVWHVFRTLRHNVLGEHSLLRYFQERIYKRVYDLLLQQHGILLQEEDEKHFKVYQSQLD